MDVVVNHTELCDIRIKLECMFYTLHADYILVNSLLVGGFTQPLQPSHVKLAQKSSSCDPHSCSNKRGKKPKRLVLDLRA